MLSGSSVLVTGSSRGLGLEMVKQLIARKPTRILATCRSPDQAVELRKLAEEAEENNVFVAKLDVTDLNSFQEFGETVKTLCGVEGLNILINNAGLAPKSTRINMVTADQMISTYITNVVAPVLLTKALLPLLGQGALARDQDSLVVNMSSILGSIAENTSQGGLYPYRASKAGLNACTKSLSLDLAKLKVGAVAIHPGWVKTEMGGKHAPLTPQESIEGVLDVLDKFNRDQNGGFYDYLGREVPW